MNNKRMIIILLFMVLMTPRFTHAGMAVIDFSNLVQNIQNTLSSFKQEYQLMVEAAQTAKEIGQSAQQINQLYEQIELAERALKRIGDMISSGDLDSIRGLNNLCFEAQHLGYTMQSIDRLYDGLYDDFTTAVEYIASRDKQAEEIEAAAKGAAKNQSRAKDDVDENAERITVAENHAKSAEGHMAELQAQSELLAIIARQQDQIQTLLATQGRLQTVLAAEQNALEKAKRAEHERLMSDWGSDKARGTKGTPRKLTEFP